MSIVIGGITLTSKQVDYLLDGLEYVRYETSKGLKSDSMESLMIGELYNLIKDSQE